MKRFPPVIILGAGGHAGVLLEMLQMLDYLVIGATDSNESRQQQTWRTTQIIGNDECVLQYAAHEVMLVNGLGSVGSTHYRRQLFEKFKRLNYCFLSLIHPSAIVSSSAVMGEGCQILAGAVVNSHAQLADNVLINTRAVIEHDCQIASHCHIASGAVLCGGVRLAAGAHVGAGATVIQGMQVGAQSVIAAGAVVTHSVADGKVVKGVPAK